MAVSRKWILEAVAHSGLPDPGVELDLDSSSVSEAWAVVCKTFAISSEALAKCVADRFGLPVADINYYQAKAVKRVPERFARRYDVFPMREENGRLVVATCDPTDLGTEQSLAFAAGLTPRFEIASPEAIRSAIKSAYSENLTANRMLETLLHNADAGQVDAVRILEQIRPEEVAIREVEETPVVKLTNLVLLEAVNRRASDIHVGPGPGGGAVRFRIDGVLQDYMTMPLPALNRVVSRIKIIGDLDITDRLRPQDGRTRIQVNDESYDLRISTVPTRDSENAVIRILDPKASMRLKDLDMPAPELERFRELLSYRNGIVIVTGPTGSGKTTTLYAGIREIANGDVNIMTVEDPVEYELPGVTQIQVEPDRDVTFASALRAILRQDPDVIFVGEIRDLETARVAVQASTTGHLVLATLHTNNATGIIPRLAELGLDPTSIESSLRGALAQRLVRRVCGQCSKPIEDDELTAEEQFLSEKYACRPVVQAIGCDRCLNTGYHGRLPIAEVFLMDYRMADLVAHSAPGAELERAATKGGMRPILKSAIDRVTAGETTLQEVSRVLGQTLEEMLEEEEATSAAPPIAAGAPVPSEVPAASADPAMSEDRVPSEAPAGSESPIAVSIPDELEPVEPLSPGLEGLIERQRPAAPVEPNGPQRVLIVDDDPQTRRFVRALLEHHEFEVTEARNGEMALELLREGSKPFSLVVLDLHMPKLGGEEVISVLRSSEHTARIPVVVLTAANGNSEVTTLERGADDYVSKPIVPDRLMARIQSTLRRAGNYR
ncbi:MAG TPA: ATPase, T2SS/T4P/T4SS family [Gemmatimonadota bacterium]|nr:ATPase, T2SS/T4P/T4SS family [Gemmatimonadota bacterium]